MLEAAHKEAMEIDSAFKNIPTYANMTVTVAIVQKRHNTRLFQVSLTSPYVAVSSFLKSLIGCFQTRFVNSFSDSGYHHVEPVRRDHLGSPRDTSFLVRFLPRSHGRQLGHSHAYPLHRRPGLVQLHSR